MPFDPSVLAPNPVVRGPILDVLNAALTAVDPYKAVVAALRRDGDDLMLPNHTYALSQIQRIFVIGAGKAGAPMTQAVEAVLGDRITRGLVVVKTDHGGPTQRVALVEASHPVPDDAGVDASRRVLALAAEADADDLVITLFSGGGSALLVAPAAGITLGDIQQMTDALLASGVTINEINCLRKHCSAVKGGQLARAAAPARLITLALSDVIGSPLDVIASGPTVPDHTTWQDAWAIVEHFALTDRLPHAIIARLQAGLRNEIADTPKVDDPIFASGQTAVVADNVMAAQAAAIRARELGFNTLLLTTHLEGEASEVAKVVAALAKEIRATGNPVRPPACLILGGETTVHLGANPGQGGRNQELALAAAVAIDGIDGVTIVALATDGTDGPTDSAGGMVDGGTIARGQALEDRKSVV